MPKKTQKKVKENAYNRTTLNGIEYLYRVLDILKGRYREIVDNINKTDIAAISDISHTNFDYIAKLSDKEINILEDEKIQKAFNLLDVILNPADRYIYERNPKNKSSFIYILNHSKDNEEIYRKLNDKSFDKSIVQDILDSNIINVVPKDLLMSLYKTKVYKISPKTLKIIKENNLHEFMNTIPYIKINNIEGAYYEFEKFLFCNIPYKIEEFERKRFRSYIHKLADNIEKCFKNNQEDSLYKLLSRLISIVYRFIDRQKYNITDIVLYNTLNKEVVTNFGYYLYLDNSTIISIIDEISEAKKALKEAEKELQKNTDEIKTKICQENVEISKEELAKKLEKELQKNGYIKDIKMKIRNKKENLDEIIEMSKRVGGLKTALKEKINNNIISINDIGNEILFDRELQKLLVQCPHCHDDNDVKHILALEPEIIYDSIVRCPYCKRVVLLESYTNDFKINIEEELMNLQKKHAKKSKTKKSTTTKEK